MYSIPFYANVLVLGSSLAIVFVSLIALAFNVKPTWFNLVSGLAYIVAGIFLFFLSYPLLGLAATAAAASEIIWFWVWRKRNIQTLTITSYSPIDENL